MTTGYTPASGIASLQPPSITMAVDLTRVNRVFLEACGQSREARAAFLEQRCAGDAELRRHVDALLAAHDRAGEPTAPPPAPEPANASTAEPQSRGMAEECADGAMRIGPYKLLQKLGEGGMGAVWVAEQTEPVKRRVALKVIKAGMDSAQVLRRFEAERQALALMDHTNIARVFDGGQTAAGRPYFVMELVKGVPITRYCDELHLPVRERLELFVPVCQAIQHAHQKGIIHRDIKPSNVLVCMQDGKPVPKVIDFGVAKALHQRLTDESMYTEIGQIIGTLEYMSPEQAELSTLDIDTRADVYALGVLLYELLTGTTPFDKKRLRQAAYTEMLRIIKEEEPPRPSTRLSESHDSLSTLAAQRRTEPARLTRAVRGELDWIVMKCLEKDRTRRYDTANGLARDLERHLHDEPVEACPPSARYRLGKILRRHKGPVLAACAVLAALAAGLVGTSWGLIRAEEAREHAETAQRAEQRRAEGEQQARLVAQKAAEAEKLATLEAKKAAEAEKLATVEAQKAAAAEKLATLEAQKAAEAEKRANTQAQTLLKQNKLATELLIKVFRDLDPNTEKFDSDTLAARMGRYLVAAARQLEDNPVGDPVVVALVQTELANSLRALGQYDEAAIVVAKAAQTLEAAGHAQRLGAKAMLADLYRRQRKYALAETLFKEVLRIQIAEGRALHDQTIDTKNDLAIVYRAQNKFSQAEALYKEVLDLRTARQGPKDDRTIITKHNLAVVYWAQQKYTEAETLLKDVIQTAIENRGANHLYALQPKGMLGLVYMDQEKYAQAEPLFQEELEGFTAKLPADHYYTLLARQHLGGLYARMKQWNRCIPLFEEMVRLQKTKHGANHPDTLIFQENLACAYRDSGRVEDGIRCLEDALARSRKLPPPIPFELDDLASELAQAYEQAKQYSKAEAIYRDLLQQARRQFGEDDVRTASPMAQLGHNLLMQQRDTEAEAILRPCVALRDKHQPDDWRTFNARSLLGEALARQKRYPDAEPLLVAGYSGIKERASKVPHRYRDRRLREALVRLVNLYESWDRPADAARWRKELDAAAIP
jgi:serine/threonine protein kinase